MCQVYKGEIEEKLPSRSFLNNPTSVILHQNIFRVNVILLLIFFIYVKNNKTAK